MLPPGVGGVAINVALAIDRRVTANLNYTVSGDVVNHCIKEVGVRHVLSTEKFINKTGLEVDAEMVMLDSLRDKVSIIDKAVAFIQAYLIPAFLLDAVLGLNKIQADDLLTVIFLAVPLECQKAFF